LADAMRYMRTYNTNYACIVGENGGLLGLFDLSAVSRKISAEVLARHEKTDAFANDYD
jgi:CBS domain containing-hemolysin-like protein